MADVVFDAAYWQKLPDGSIQLRATPLSIAFPVAGAVVSSADPFGYSNAPVTPTRLEPDEDEVLRLVEYGDPSDPRTGTLSASGGGEPPAAPDVTASVSGTTVTVPISGASDNTSNEVYTQPLGSSTRTLRATVPGDGTGTFTLTPGRYWVLVKSIGLDDQVTWVVGGVPIDVGSTETARYRVKRILYLPGSPTKELILERVERPTHP